MYSAAIHCGLRFSVNKLSCTTLWTASSQQKHKSEESDKRNAWNGSHRLHVDRTCPLNPKVSKNIKNRRSCPYDAGETAGRRDMLKIESPQLAGRLKFSLKSTNKGLPRCQTFSTGTQSFRFHMGETRMVTRARKRKKWTSLDNLRELRVFQHAVNVQIPLSNMALKPTSKRHRRRRRSKP